MSWHAAKEYFEKLGGHLATATTKEENRFIYNQFGRDHVCWLGATDEKEEGVWKWITGEPWEYQNWFPNEPNNSGNVEHYLAFGNTGSIVVEGRSYYYRFSDRWNDHSGAGTYHGVPICYPVCEWDKHDPDKAVDAPEIIDENQIAQDIRTLLARAEFDEAAAQLEAALEKRPDSARLWSIHLMAYSYLARANRTEEAARHLEAYVDYQMKSTAKTGGSADAFGRYFGPTCQFGGTTGRTGERFAGSG